MYLAYKCFLADKNQHRYNRMVLYSIYALSVFVPFVRGLHILRNVTISVDMASSITTLSTTDGTVRTSDGNIVALALILIYSAGVLFFIVTSIFAWIKLRRVVKSGDSIKYNNHNLVIIDDERIAPFSWCNNIVMNKTDYEQAGEMILAHESLHIEQHHQIDLVVSQIFIIWQWYNPAAWLLRSELVAIHEYQADMNVLVSGFNARDYQIMLLKKAVGKQFPAFANSIYHSIIKKRITMMSNKKRCRFAKFGGFALVPAVALTIAAFNMPFMASAMSELNSAKLPTFSKRSTTTVDASNSEVTRNVQISNVIFEENVAETETQPEFPGGESAMWDFLIKNLKWPSDTSKSKISTRTIVQFNIGTDGTISDVTILQSSGYDYFDKEAIRVINLMPKWTPGKSDGKPVASTFKLPIRFKSN
jgi:TonB family protein